MFQPTQPQLSLLEVRFLISENKRARLLNSWAEVFRSRVLPSIDEEPLRDSFHADMGRPNASIRLLTGLHLLKEEHDFTDEELLDNLEFNLQWQHALGVEPATAHLCQKTLHNFRLRLIEDDRALDMFTKLTKAMAEVDGINFKTQRLDSTHVISNIAVLTRLGLFVETVTHFLKVLRKDLPLKYEALPVKYGARYLDREGYFADSKRNTSPRRLKVVAHDAWRLLERYRDDLEVSKLEAYALLSRLVSEQCQMPAENVPAQADEKVGGESGREPIQLEAFPSSETDTDGDEAIVEENTPVKSPETPAPEPQVTQQEARAVEPEVMLKAPATVDSSSLQSPHDKDVTYGHKGKGYEAQLAETCGDENPYQLITYVEVNGAHESDQKQTIPVIERLAEDGMKPEKLIADTNYGSGKNIVEAGKRGVDLQAPVQSPTSRQPDGSLLDEPVEGVVAPPEAGASEPKDEASESSPAEPEKQPLRLEDFTYSMDYQTIILCPFGKSPIGHRSTADGARIIVVFNRADCEGCPFAEQCPTRARGRLFDSEMSYKPEEAATSKRQKEQEGAEFKTAYRIRSGIESTNSTLKGALGADDLRVRGKERVRLTMILKVMALNAQRCVDYHLGEMRKAVASSEAGAAA